MRRTFLKQGRVFELRIVEESGMHAVLLTVDGEDAEILSTTPHREQAERRLTALTDELFVGLPEVPEQATHWRELIGGVEFVGLHRDMIWEQYLDRGTGGSDTYEVKRPWQAIAGRDIQLPAAVSGDSRRLCPRCAQPTLPVLYGRPTPRARILAMLGLVILGGCVVGRSPFRQRCRTPGCTAET